VLTGISIYTAVFLITYWLSVLKRSILFKNNVLHLRIRILWDVAIQKGNIFTVSRVKNFEENKSILKRACLKNLMYQST
jgi:hypothetical protein